MHVFSAATHLFARLDTSPSRDDAGFIALPTRDEGLCPRLFGLLAGDGGLGARPGGRRPPTGR